MNVKQLKAMLENVPDDAQVLLSGRDHSYCKGSAHYIFVEYNDKEYYEYYDDANMGQDGKKEKHLVID